MPPHGHPDRQVRLTRELARLCHREVEEQPSDPRYEYFTEADYRHAVAGLIASKPPGPFWIFAYGSLMWKPESPAVETRRAVAHGWQRGFSLRIEGFRATPEQPGYMMCLDPGGSCQGMVLRLADDDLEAQLGKLLTRELGSHEALEAVRWIATETPEGPVTALTFYAGPQRLDDYAQNRPVAEVAHALARACGHWGSGAEYLCNTVAHLEELGIRDEGLWILQDLVAQEIEALYGRS
jgi:cation transport protein ChaC